MTRAYLAAQTRVCHSVEKGRDMIDRTARIGIALLVAAIWGYFSDLQSGQAGWFVGRLIFVPCFVEGFYTLLRSRHEEDKSGQ